jgi:two-component sensor histidine kinase
MTRLSAQLSFADATVLLHELNHRVNNEFASAITVASLAAARSGNSEVKTALTAVTELLQHYASVHHALRMPEHGDAVLDAEAYLRQLCLSINRSHLDSGNIRLSLAIEPLLLPADISWRLAMIVYELIINAVRHAFEAGGGEICVTVRRDGAFVTCGVQDNGSAASSIQPGRGRKLVEALSSALGGRFKQIFGPHGSTAIVIFPCAGASNNHRRRRPKENQAPLEATAGRRRTSAGDALATCR